MLRSVVMYMLQTRRIIVSVCMIGCVITCSGASAQPVSTQIFADNTGSFDWFGWRADLTDSVLVISAAGRRPPVSGGEYGAAYVFRLSGEGPMGGWEQEADLWGVGGGFPNSIAYVRDEENEFIAGGAPSIQGPNPAPFPGPGWDWGGVHTFVHSEGDLRGSNMGWMYERTLQPEEVGDFDRTGSLVDLLVLPSGGISMPTHSGGDIVFFERTSGGQGSWVETQRVVTDGNIFYLFADESVNRPFIATHGGLDNVHVYRRGVSPAGTTDAWEFEVELIASDIRPSDRITVVDVLGAGEKAGGVLVAEDWVLLMRHDLQGDDHGAVAFRKDADSGEWVEDIAFDLPGAYENTSPSVQLGWNQRGQPITFSLSRFLIAHVLERVGQGDWQEVAEVSLPDLGVLGTMKDVHGTRVALSNHVADTAGQDSGAAWLVDFAPVLPVAGEQGPESQSFSLSVVPNPARGAVNVVYTLSESGTVQLTLIDVLGRTVYTEQHARAAGRHHSFISTTDLSAGTYALRLDSGQHTGTTWLTVVR